MATLSIATSYDMSEPIAWSGIVTAHDKSFVTVEAPPLKAKLTSSHKSLFYRSGNDFPYRGTLTDIQQFYAETLQYELSGGKFSVAKVMNYFNDKDIIGLEQYLLAGNDNISGSAYQDTLLGWAGNDVLDGGGDADTLQGGKGNDTYVVDELDYVSEIAKEGTDLVLSSMPDYTLGDNVENLTLIGVGEFNGTGNALKNKLIGNDVNNRLDGGDRQDTLIGGKGDDVYVVDLIKSGSSLLLQDKLIEKANEGKDSLELRLSGVLSLSKAATLQVPGNIENLNAGDTGSLLFNLTGNGLDNKLIGNVANNILDGKSGQDTLIGGSGNDSYVIDTPEDMIIEDTLGGVDLVKIDISLIGGKYLISDNMENATLISKVDFNLVGNALDNSILGNQKDNLIDGGAGADTLDGNGGVDTVSYENSVVGVSITLNGNNGIGGDAQGDVLKNFENIIGSAYADVLTGDAGDNVISGANGADTLIGGNGNDIYHIDNSEDVIIETDTKIEKNAGSNDLAICSIDYSMAENLENVTQTGHENINATGNDLNNKLIGNSGNNRIEGGIGDDNIDGGNGIDVLSGGIGNDTYKVDLVVSARNQIDLEDRVIENNKEGTDSLFLYNGRNVADGEYVVSLGENLENMDASNTDINLLSLLGNSLDNLLIGNHKNNTLNGGDGKDSLNGGDGTDTLTGGLGLDLFIFTTAPSSSNVDHITDFSRNNGDTIRLNYSVFQNAGTLGKNIDTAEFLATDTLSATASQHILYKKSTGELFYNPDGSSLGELMLIAVLDGQPALSNIDISLI